jgi:hypothetical protein
MGFNKKYISNELIKKEYEINGVEGVVKLYTNNDATLLSGDVNEVIAKYAYSGKLNELDSFLNDNIIEKDQ